MSLFERIKNKRHDLIEQPDFSSKQRSDNLKMLNRMFGSKTAAKETADKAVDDAAKKIMTPTKDDIAKEKSIFRQQKKIQKRQNNQNKGPNNPEYQKLLNQKRRNDQAYDAFDDSDAGRPGTGNTVDNTKSRTVKQSEVSKKAKDFTKEINKKNKNLKRAFVKPDERPTGEVPKTTKPKTGTGEGQVKYPKTRKELIAKRKEYGIDRKGNISDAGVKRYAQKTKQLSSGSNLPVTPTKKELEIAKRRAVGGDKVTNKSGKVIGTTTGKYGGRLGRSRNKNMKTYDQIKRDIDLKDIQKASDAKARKIARSQELKDLTKKMGEKELYQKVTQKAQLKSIRPQRQFYKGALGTTKNITKAFGGSAAKVSPAVKTGLKTIAKAGPAGAIVAGTGLALLNPSIRKGAKRIATAALGAAGVKAFIPKPKKVERPPSKIGINLSPKA